MLVDRSFIYLFIYFLWW